MRLLDPTRSAWSDHFQLKTDTLQPVLGDPDAEYTADSYDINDPRKVTLRGLRRTVITDHSYLIAVGLVFLKIVDRFEHESPEQTRVVGFCDLVSKRDYLRHPNIRPLIERNHDFRKKDAWRAKQRQPASEADLGHRSGRGIPVRSNVLDKRVWLSSDGRRAISSGFDKDLHLWDVDSGHLLQCFEGHTDRVFSVAFTPDGRQAISASWDQTLRLWDVDTGREQFFIPSSAPGNHGSEMPH